MITMEENGKLPKKYKGEYESKRIFVNELKSSILRANVDVLDIRYTHPSEHQEFVEIHYYNGGKDTINVHMNSMNVIGLEIFRQISGEGAFGLCRRS